MGSIRLEVRTVAPRSANVTDEGKVVTESVVFGAVRIYEGDQNYPVSGELFAEVPAGNYVAGQLVDAALSAPFDPPVAEPAPPVALPDETPPEQPEVPPVSSEPGEVTPADPVPADSGLEPPPPAPEPGPSVTSPEEAAAVDADQEARIAALEAEEAREAAEGTP